MLSPPRGQSTCSFGSAACQRDATSRALRFPPPSRRARARRSHPTLAAPFSLVSHLAPSSFAPRSPCTTLNTRSSLPSLHHAALLAPRSPCTTVRSLCTTRFFRTKPLAHHAHHASSWSLPHRRATLSSHPARLAPRASFAPNPTPTTPTTPTRATRGR